MVGKSILLGAVLGAVAANALPGLVARGNSSTSAANDKGVFYTTLVDTISTTTTATDTETTTQTAYVITTGFPCEGENGNGGSGTALTTINGGGSQPTASPVVAETAYTYTGHSGPVSTLNPAISYNHNTSDLANLAPASSSQLYYTDSGIADPAVKHLFAQLDTNFVYSAVILEHSKFVGGVSCHNEGLTVTFTTTEAFHYAKGSWIIDSVGFVLVTHTSGCGTATTGQRTYWLVSGVSFTEGSLAAQVKCIEIALEEAIDEIDMVWGTHHPASPTKGSSGSHNGATGTAGAQGPGYTGG
ncbi:MAG: hypothetical protein M4579_007391, partial [Chaenotheca gracillima]